MRWKYRALADFLKRQTAEQVTCTFPQIEALLGAPLPASSLEPWWWSSTPEAVRAPAGAWLGAGWKVKVVEPATREMTFERRNGDRT
jgi:hypothetical protein